MYAVNFSQCAGDPQLQMMWSWLVKVRHCSFSQRLQRVYRQLCARQHSTPIMIPVTIAAIKVMRHLGLLYLQVVLAVWLCLDNAWYTICNPYAYCPQKLYLAWIVCLHNQANFMQPN